MSEGEERKLAAARWFAELRDRLCAAFEAIEEEFTGTHRPAGHFVRKDWRRPTPDDADGGGGTMAIMKGRVFEKVGVNISTVFGRFDPQFAKEVPGAQEDPSGGREGDAGAVGRADAHAPRRRTCRESTVYTPTVA